MGWGECYIITRKGDTNDLVNSKDSQKNESTGVTSVESVPTFGGSLK